MTKKIIISSVLLSLIAFLSSMCFEAMRAINKHDLSTSKAATCNLKVKGPIYLITYADGDVYEANAKVLAESALNNCIDAVYIYRKEHLDSEFVQKNQKLLKEKRGAGYWVWKPYIALKTLEEIPENAIMIYLDAGIKILHPLDNFINNIENYDMVLVDNIPHTNKQYTKRYLFKLMDMDKNDTHNTVQLNAGIFVVKNTVRTRGFVQKWLEIAQNERAINDDIDQDEYPEFKQHRHDQSILSLLYLQNPEGIKIAHTSDILEYILWHRRSNINMSLFMLDYVAKDWPTPKEYIMRIPLLERILYGLLGIERKIIGQ